MADISDTLAPKSDQLDAVDLLSGPRTFTVTRVDVKTSDEQPVNVHLDEFPRPWRPGKSMRRVLAAAWGADSSVWTGRRVTLYCDPTVKFGGEAVGGTRISHMTDLPGGKPLSVPLLVSRGKSQMFTVKPLTEPAAKPSKAAPKPTAAQMKRLAEGFAAAGITNSDGKARFIAEATGRTLNGWDDLTPDDVAKTIDALEPLVGNDAPEPPVDVDAAWGLGGEES